MAASLSLMRLSPSFPPSLRCFHGVRLFPSPMAVFLRRKLSSSKTLSGSSLVLPRSLSPIPSPSQKPSKLTVFAAKGYKMKTHKVTPSAPFSPFWFVLRRSPLSFPWLAGVGEAVSGDGEGDYSEAAVGEAALAREEKHQEEAQALQNGELLLSHSSFNFEFLWLLGSSNYCYWFKFIEIL